MRHEFKIDFAFVDINSRNLHADRITKTVDARTTLTNEALAGLVIRVVVAGQRTDMNQPFDEHTVEFDKKAELRNTGDNTFKRVTDMPGNIVTLDPLKYVVHRLVSTAFGKRAAFTHHHRGFHVVGVPGLAVRRPNAIDRSRLLLRGSWLPGATSLTISARTRWRHRS